MTASAIHGSTGYRGGCRCAICLAAKARFDKTPEGIAAAERRAFWLASQSDKAERRAHWEAIQANKARTPEQIIADQERLWPSGTKRCPQCDQRKPLRQFGIDKSRNDGRTERCRDCRNAPRA